MGNKLKSTLSAILAVATLAAPGSSAWAEGPVMETPSHMMFAPENLKARKGSSIALMGTLVLDKDGGASMRTRLGIWKLEHLDVPAFRADSNQEVQVLGIVVKTAEDTRPPSVFVQDLRTAIRFPLAWANLKVRT